MDVIWHSLWEIFEPFRLLMLLVGASLGLVIGIIPGLSGIAGMALLVPFTYALDPYSAMALLLGMGSVTTTSDTVSAVLFGVPGTVGSAATVIDGHAMAKHGQAERALGAAFSASLLGGVIGVVVLAASIPVLQPWIRAVGSPELFAIAVFGLSMVASLSTASPLMGLMSVCAGLLCAFVALDNQTATERWTGGMVYLWEGIPLVPLFLGIFAIPELTELSRAKSITRKVDDSGRGTTMRGVSDTVKEFALVFRTGILGAVLGSIPGIGGAVIDWIAYGHARRSIRQPHSLGDGDVRGVIAPESANNAKEGGALVPTLAFGVPGTASMTILLGALMVQGIVPGPDMLTKHLDLTVTMMLSIALANVFGTAVCLALTSQFARITVLPAQILVPLVLVFVAFGAFQANRDVLDFVVLIAFGALGLFMKAAGWSRPAFALGFVLGPAVERYFFISHAIFEWAWLARPIVAILLALGIVTIFRVLPEALKAIKSRSFEPDRKKATVPTQLASWMALLIGLLGLYTTATWPQQAAAFPILVLTVLVLSAALSIMMIYLSHSNWREQNLLQAIRETVGNLRVVAMATAFIGLLLLLGWSIATPLFVFLALLLHNVSRIVSAVVISAFMTVFCWLIFDLLLAIPWPQSYLATMFGL
jgi:TctA family transporter